METKDFTEGPIFKPLIHFILPLLLTDLLQALFSAGNIAVIGHFGTTADIAAVNTGSDWMETVRFLLVASSQSVLVLLGQKIGGKNDKDAGIVFGSGIGLYAILGSLFGLLLFLPANTLTRLLNTPPESFDLTVRYIRISATGMVFVAVFNVFSNVFRAIGDSRTPMWIGFGTFSANFLADCLLVGKFRMGSQGAALTDVTAQFLSVLFSIIALRKRGLPFGFSMNMLLPDRAVSAELIRIGMPLALQDFLVSISYLVISNIINGLGVAAAAGYGVATRLNYFPLYLLDALSQTVSTFTAQNIGGRKPDRAKQSLFYGIVIGLIISIPIGLVLYFKTGVFLKVFTGNKTDVIHYGTEAMRAFSLETLYLPILFCFIGFLTGMGHTRFILLEGILGSMLVQVPFAWLMSRQVPVSMFRICLASLTSSSTKVLVNIVYFCYLNRHPEKMAPIESSQRSAVSGQ